MRKKNVKTPTKSIEEEPRVTRRTSRRRNKSHEPSPEPQLKNMDQTPVEVAEENDEEEKAEEPLWQVKTAETDSSGEIQKLKLCLQRPSSTPERVDRSPRRHRKHKYESTDSNDDKPKKNKRSRRGHRSEDESVSDDQKITENDPSSNQYGEISSDQKSADESLESTLNQSSDNQNQQTPDQSHNMQSENKNREMEEDGENEIFEIAKSINDRMNSDSSNSPTNDSPFPAQSLNETQMDGQISCTKIKVDEKVEEIKQATKIVEVQAEEEKIQKETEEKKVVNEIETDDKEIRQSEKKVRMEDKPIEERQVKAVDKQIEKNKEETDNKNNDCNETSEIENTNRKQVNDKRRSEISRVNDESNQIIDEENLEKKVTEKSEHIASEKRKKKVSHEMDDDMTKSTSQIKSTIEQVVNLDDDVESDNLETTNEKRKQNLMKEIIKETPYFDEEALPPPDPTRKKLKLDNGSYYHKMVQRHTSKILMDQLNLDNFKYSCNLDDLLAMLNEQTFGPKRKVSTTTNEIKKVPSYKSHIFEKLGEKIVDENGMDDKIIDEKLTITRKVILNDTKLNEYTATLNESDMGETALQPASPSKNPPTAILHVKNLVRPFTLNQLRELLSRTGNICDENGFWINNIKSECFVKYQSQEEAEETRNALHGVHWPVANGKRLEVDFGTEEQMANVLKHNEIHVANNNHVNDEKKEEVDWRAERERERLRREQRGTREWDKGKEKDERAKSRSRSRHRTIGDDKRKEHHHHRKSMSPKRVHSISPDRKGKKRTGDEHATPAPAKLLDDLFRKTKATPCIYWLPLSPQQIAVKEEQRRKHVAEHERRIQEIRKSRMQPPSSTSSRRR